MKELFHTRKYPLRGYFLGVLTHTTAWDRLWGGDVFLRLYIRSSASPRVAAVGLGCWNCEHVVLRVAIWIDIRIYDHDETWKCDGMQVAGCRLALPCPAQQWHQCDSECIFVTLKIHLITLFSEIFHFDDFFLWLDGTWQTDGRTNKRTDIGTDRLFSENIILDIVVR